MRFLLFIFDDPALTVIYTLSLHDALPISPWSKLVEEINAARTPILAIDVPSGLNADTGEPLGTAICATVTLTLGDRKSTRLNSSHVSISYAVFCLKKKTTELWDMASSAVG